MKKVLGYLEGKKTYVGIIAGAVYLVLIEAGVVESDTVIWGLIATWTGVSANKAIHSK